MRVLKSAAEAGGVSPLSSVDGAFRFGIESRTQIDSKLICADASLCPEESLIGTLISK